MIRVLPPRQPEWPEILAASKGATWFIPEIWSRVLAKRFCGEGSRRVSKSTKSTTPGGS